MDFTKPENCLLLHLDNTVSSLHTHTHTRKYWRVCNYCIIWCFVTIKSTSHVGFNKVLILLFLIWLYYSSWAGSLWMWTYQTTRLSSVSLTTTTGPPPSSSSTTPRSRRWNSTRGKGETGGRGWMGEEGRRGRMAREGGREVNRAISRNMFD